MLERLGKPVPAIPSEQMQALLSQQIERAIDRLRERPGIRLLEVDYPGLTNDPAPAVQAVVELLRRCTGVELDPQAMIRQVDPKLYRERGSQ